MARAGRLVCSGEARSLGGVLRAVHSHDHPPGGVSSTLDSWLRIHNVATLCKHLAGITAAYAVLTFVYDVAQDQATSLRGSRPRIVVPLAAGVGLTLLFFAAPQPGEATDPLTDFADDWHIAVYGVIWSGYLGTALVSATRLCWRWGRLPEAGLLGRGLRITGLGTALGIVYAGHHVPALMLRYFGLTPAPPRTDETSAAPSRSGRWSSSSPETPCRSSVDSTNGAAPISLSRGPTLSGLSSLPLSLQCVSIHRAADERQSRESAGKRRRPHG